LHHGIETVTDEGTTSSAEPGGGPEEVVPIAGDSVSTPSEEAETDEEVDPLVTVAQMLGYPGDTIGGMDVSPPNINITFDAGAPVNEPIVDIAGDSAPPVDDLQSFGADGSYVPSAAPSPPPSDSSCWRRMCSTSATRTRHR